MSKRWGIGVKGVLIVGLFSVAQDLSPALRVSPALAAAQAPPPAAPEAGATINVEADPIRCWWRTSASAVRVGEPFTVVLTCAVVENEATTVVPDQSRLEPARASVRVGPEPEHGLGRSSRSG